MAAKTNKSSTTVKNTAVKQNKTAKVEKESRDFAEILDSFFTRNTRLFLFISLFLSVLFSILLFDVKPGIGGDDSSYIIRTFDLLNGGKFPSYQGPMYPFILAPFVALFGIKLALLKSLSLIFVVLSIYFTYKAFEKKIPQSILVLSILILSINYNLLFFSSQTYSEGFFLLIQSLFFWTMSHRFFNGEDPEQAPFKKFIIPGLLLFIMAITKNIAYVAIAATIGYFILNMKWRSSIKILGSFLIFFIAFEILKRLIWGANQLQIAGQGSSLLLKDFYNPALGNEDFMGFVNRFFVNSNLYFSKHLANFLGFRIDILTVSVPYTIIIWGLILNAFFWAFKKNKYMLLLSVYTICMSAGIFISIQTKWDQWRLIIILFPLILTLILSGLYYAFKTKNFLFQAIPLVLAVIIFFSTFKVTGNKAKVQKEILAKNLSGNMLYGYTPDWVNYIQMSRWAAKNTPLDKLTAVRKADISFIYGERKFFGINQVPSLTVDSFLKTLPDTSRYYGLRIVDNTSYSKLASNPNLQSRINGFVSGKFAFKGVSPEEGSTIAILRVSKNETAQFDEILKSMDFDYEANCLPWIQNLKTLQGDYAIYVPEMLLDYLKKANVKYMLLASLRANPNVNTGNIITTLHRFVYYVQIKYPNIFRVVYTIGDEENAELIEVNI